MSDQNELYYAHMEADRNEAEKAYFEARPSLGAEVDRALFRAGFERAYAKLWPLWIIQLNEQQRASKETRVVDDGFGNQWRKCSRPDCSLAVVRPGKVDCNGECEGP